MRRFIKLLLFVGIILVLIGGTIAGIAYAKNGFKKKKIEVKTYEIEEDFQNFDIELLTSNLELIPSTDGKNKLVYDALEGYGQEIMTKDDTLYIKEKEELKWYDRIFKFNWQETYFKLYLNQNTYKALTLDVSTGDVTISGFNFDSLAMELSTGDVSISNSNVSNDISIKVSTGYIKLDGVFASNISVKSSTGDMSLIDTVSLNKLALKASTGSIKLSKVDGKEINIDTSTGDVRGSILTPKTFQAHTSTGDVHVPNTEGDICKISTSTGNINITISA